MSVYAVTRLLAANVGVEPAGCKVHLVAAEVRNLLFRLISVAIVGCSAGVQAQDNRIDVIRHDAPELANFGEHDVGVRTLAFTDSNRPDILNTPKGEATRFYSRSLTVEVWYPASLSERQQPGTRYTTSTRNPGVTAILHGRAVRDALPKAGSRKFPLVIISHGYPGNRYLMSHLGENLASKGYVVASIDHRDSTYENQAAFASTLYNRPLDQLFVLEQIAAFSDRSDSFLSGLVNADNTGIVGYSMGGYGLILNIGGGYSEAMINHSAAPPNDELARRHAASNPSYRSMLDGRIKAAFAIAPWGMASGVWDTEDLHDIEIPTFYLSGSADDTAGYETGTRALFNGAIRSDRYLLTFINAGHSAGAPIPLPVEISRNSDQTGASHYTDPVWDSVRMNNIMDHFATAFFDYYLKGANRRLSYLKPQMASPEGANLDTDNSDGASPDSALNGFEPGTYKGLELEFLGAAE